jgi:beta-glucanase (GH16 family)
MLKLKIFFFVGLLALCSACSKNSDGSTDTSTPSPSLRISDVQLFRNNVAPTTFHFVVTVDKVSSKEIKVDYATVDGNTNGDEYTKKSGTLTIPANAKSANIDIAVKGDSLREEDKIFYVQLSNPVNAKLSNSGKGTGTIICDGTYLPVDNSGYSSPASYPGYTLSWSDEFNGKELDKSSWNYETGANGWGNNELENYTNSTTNSFITSSEYLVIEARKEGSAYTSARIQTMGKREFTHGRVDIRARLPKGQGVWPALWMLGSNIGTTPWPACGEIDIMELLGHQPNKIYGTMHWGNAGEGSTHIGGDYTLPSEDFSQKFHVFSIVWDSTKIEWLVDDQKYFTGTKDQVNGNYPFDKPFFFIFNVAVGGNWPGNPDANTAFPQRMIVDYIRVFQ